MREKKAEGPYRDGDAPEIRTPYPDRACRRFLFLAVRNAWLVFWPPKRWDRILRMQALAVCVVFVMAFASGTAFARGHGGGYGHSSYHSASYHYTSRAPSYRVYRSPRYRSHAYTSGSHYNARRGGHAYTHAAYGLQRDRHGRIARSEHAKRTFERQHPCPSTGRASGRCPGYVIDHVRALKRGGADDPSNMQWQTTQDAKAKDRTE